MDSGSPTRLSIAVAMLVAMAGLAPPAQATLPGRNGKIAFERNDPPNTRNVFTVDPDGTDLQNLTNLRANSFSPVWSPNGARLAFESDLEPSGVGGDSYYNVFTVGADGGGLAQLTDVEGAASPSWSPSGDAIAYASGGGIYRASTDGSERLLLASGSEPEWSPDGSRIAFKGEDGRLHMISADGGNERVVTASPVNSSQWSPDGSMLAYETWRPPPCSSERGFCWEIRTIGANGQGERTISQADEAYGPDWSPDSTRIAYFGPRDGNWDIFVVDADGTGHTRLTTSPDLEDAPVWSPDGASVAFLGGSEVQELRLMNVDGSGQRFLAEGFSTPSWQSLPLPHRKQNAAHLCKAGGKRGRALGRCVRATRGDQLSVQKRP